MSTRILSVQEIQAVGSVIKDKEAIQLLKEIRDNVITEEDTKGKRKGNEVFNFVGFSSGDDLLGEDSEAEDYKSKKAKIDGLVASGLVLEGFHIPLERKSEKKFGDVRISATDEKIYKYQITDVGYAILALVEEEPEKKDNSAGSQSSSSSSSQQSQQQQQTTTNESKEIKEFKASQQKEQKQQEEQKQKEIEAFKAAQYKELNK